MARAVVEISCSNIYPHCSCFKYQYVSGKMSHFRDNMEHDLAHASISARYSRRVGRTGGGGRYAGGGGLLRLGRHLVVDKVSTASRGPLETYPLKLPSAVASTSEIFSAFGTSSQEITPQVSYAPGGSMLLRSPDWMGLFALISRLDGLVCVPRGPCYN